MKLSAIQTNHLIALVDGARSSYPGLKYGTLEALERKKLVSSIHHPGSMFSRANGVIWKLTDAGSKMLDELTK